MKKVIAFDLDGTLADSKSPISEVMSELLGELLDNFHVCVISGGKFGQFEKQLLANLHAEPRKLERLHLLPTCGTRYYVFSVVKNTWDQIYAEDIAEKDKKRITTALEHGIDALGYREPKPWGALIEDRGSQITFSALGQEAPVESKEAWDPKQTKKHKLRDYVAECIPEFEVRTGGTTSIDITKLGIDKAYGMRKLIKNLKLSQNDILFLGDRLEEGGNDYPVKAMGIDCVEVKKWQDTAIAIKAILHMA